MDYQHTIARPVEVAGIGLHSAVAVKIRLAPAPVNKGIVFRRTDLDNFEIPASWKYIARVSYATSLMRKGVLISTTEHILSALIGSGIDNVAIEIDSLELPILDGSGKVFVEMIQKAGKRRQSAPRKFLRVLKPVEVVEGHKRISIFPDKGFRIRSTVDFPHPLVGSQGMEINLTEQNYATEVAPARTFGFLNELPQMRNMGLIRGASLENAVCFTDDGVINADGLRYSDEPCRHKLLDLIGDLALIGHPLRAFVDAERAGHAMHTAVVLKLVKDRSLWELTTSDAPAIERPISVPALAFGEAMSD